MFVRPGSARSSGGWERQQGEHREQASVPLRGPPLSHSAQAGHQGLSGCSHSPQHRPGATLIYCVPDTIPGAETRPSPEDGTPFPGLLDRQWLLRLMGLESRLCCVKPRAGWYLCQVTPRMDGSSRSGTALSGTEATSHGAVYTQTN